MTAVSNAATVSGDVRTPPGSLTDVHVALLRSSRHEMALAWHAGLRACKTPVQGSSALLLSAITLLPSTRVLLVHSSGSPSVHTCGIVSDKRSRSGPVAAT